MVRAIARKPLILRPSRAMPSHRQRAKWSESGQARACRLLRYDRETKREKGKIMRVILGALAMAMLGAMEAAAEWTLSEAADPFDDQRVITATLRSGEIELQAVCKDPGGKQTYRAYILLVDEQETDWYRGSDMEITTKLRFDSSKARFVTFFATDDRKGMWAGQWLGARLARSWIEARKMTLLLTGVDGAERVVQMDLPEDAEHVRSTLAACDQKITGKTYL